MGFLIPDRVYNANGVTVKEYLLTNHNPNRIGMPSKRTKPLAGVTIHNTEDINEAQGTTDPEQYTRATVNGNMKSVRVHFYVDDREAWQNLPLNWQGWHAADGNGDGNTATIAIEVIGNSAKAEDNAARLAAWLLSQNNMSVDKLYTHTYWLNVKDGKGTKLTKDERCTLHNSYKDCPIYIIPHWSAFVNKVKAYQTAGQAVETDGYKYCVVKQYGVYDVKSNADEVLKTLKTDDPQGYYKIMKVKK